MSSEFFNKDISIFLEKRVDWETFFRLKSAEDFDLGQELDTFKTILSSLGEICEDIENDSKPAWHDEVVLTDGTVEKPAHIVAGYNRLRDAGLTCMMLGEVTRPMSTPVTFAIVQNLQLYPNL